MTKANAQKKMEKLGTVTLDGNGPDFRVALDYHDLICICNPGPEGDVITFVAERCADGFQTFHKTFNKALVYLGTHGEG